VVARPDRVPASVASRRPAVPVRGRAKRPLRVVAEPESLSPVSNVAAERPCVLAGAPVRGSGRLDDDQLRGSQALRGRALPAASASTAPPLPQAGCAHSGRVRWLRDLRRLVRRTPWIRSVAWFQHRSRAQVQIEHAGKLDWDVQRDPVGAAALRGVIRALAAARSDARARRPRAGRPRSRRRP